MLLAALVMLAGASAVFLGVQSVTPEAFRFRVITVDRLSAALTLLVASVGAITFRFSQHYLHGEPGRRRFLRWLSFTVVMAYCLMLSTNLLLLFTAWSLTSLGLHRLLTHYPDRQEAIRPARKKFLISRFGDMALVSAIVLIWQGWGTLDLHVFLDRVAASSGSIASGCVGILIVVAALTKSAQFPFHSWLPETMEAPTPVSALMHAGIINAGGALLLRFAPLIVRVPEALLVLSCVGTFTVVLGMLAMWAQTKIKRTLAWSTVNQMGFMMIQLGVAAFPAAALHILGHGCYKAWSFLRSGEVPTPAASPTSASPVRTLALALLGTGIALPSILLASWVTGFSPLHSPGELALSAITALSMGQLWIALLGDSKSNYSTPKRIVATTVATVVVVVSAFALYRGAGAFLSPVLGELPAPSSSLAWVAAILPVIAIVLLTVIQAMLPALGHTSFGRAFYVHAVHGFYFGAVADRIVEMMWRRLLNHKKEVAHV
ncbi:proton-conducting transporter membrane subunit [soil metagenome]